MLNINQIFNFLSFLLDKLKEYHPAFRYPLLTIGDYEPYMHQLEIFFRLATRKPIRFLIGDDVGLGKTIEGIMLIDQIIKRGGKNILLILPKTLVQQWIYELNKFSNEWKLSVYDYYQNKSVNNNGICVVSIDTFKRDEHLSQFINIKWDLILVDEIHKVGIIGNKENKRYESIKKLVYNNINSNFIGLSATPHKGNREDYFKRMLLIDPKVNENSLDKLPLILILKRNKNMINNIYEEDKIFTNATFIQIISNVTEDEREYYNLIVELSLNIIKEYYNMKGQKPNALPLLAFIIGRRAMSSPKAGFLTFKSIVERRSSALIKMNDEEELDEFAEEEESSREIDEIANEFVEKYANLLEEYKNYVDKLMSLANKVMENDTRLNRVIEKVKENLDKGNKVIIFTEYKDTAEYIYKGLENKLKLNKKELLVIHSENLNKVNGIEGVKKWLAEGNRKVLITTDVASEGLNLQEANILIHYELPLSLVRFEQRNGRVWRLKQKKEVEIYYITLNTDIEMNLIDNYYNKLLEVMRTTKSEPPITRKIEYADRENNIRVIDLSKLNTNVSLSVGYVDPKNKNKKITSLTVYEALIQGNIGSVVNELINRIKTFAKYSETITAQSEQMIRNDLDYVRRLTGFNNRKDMRESLNTFLEELIHKLNGNIATSVKGEREIRVSSFVRPYDPTRLGETLEAIYAIIRRESRKNYSGNEFYIITDALDYNLYFVLARIKLGKEEVFAIPFFIKDNGEIVRLSEVFKNVLPEVMKGNSKQVEVLSKDQQLFTRKFLNFLGKLKRDVFGLISPYVMYKSSVKNNNWLPNSIDDLNVVPELIGGIFGIRNKTIPPDPVIIQRKINGQIQDNKIKLLYQGKYEEVEVVAPKDLFKRNTISLIDDFIVIGSERI
ncbi:DEAD/DEAH box helicase [Sulfolobus sp. E11-6]|uniref:DEAD/DEAH box helicase n=1 Tax=Sulfolobus sp. E11-6 TaxID=2663020 RepID=UPI001296A9BF|nr:DEAD/DEAH box helicase [Sulfolobus sp. E11-6]QGA69063.1 helicase [Sulfolobus sp. E11-6]